MTIDRTVTVQVTLTPDEVIAAILKYVGDRLVAEIEQPFVTVYEGEPFVFYSKVVGVAKSPDPLPV